MDGGGVGGGSGSDPGGVSPGLGGTRWGRRGPVGPAEAKFVLVALVVLALMCCVGLPVLGLIWDSGSGN